MPNAPAPISAAILALRPLCLRDWLAIKTTWVVPFAPAGDGDIIGRIWTKYATAASGANIVVDNKAGAGGAIGAAEVARAKADGYTLLLATGGHAVAGALYNNLAYRTVQDFEMVSTITYFPFLVVVPANSKYANLTALLAAAKANPAPATP